MGRRAEKGDDDDDARLLPCLKVDDNLSQLLDMEPSDEQAPSHDMR